MASRSLASTLLSLLLASRTIALQVTPNSPCAAICLDGLDQDVSDPKTSNTFGSDIVCRDDDYSKMVIGKKFKSCVSCLQASSASGSGEHDQGWFLYNLRYSLSSCLFGFTNTTDSVQTSCSTETTCGPLEQALKTGLLDPENESSYSYCSADENAFLGSHLSKCVACLQSDGEEKYAANFLLALQAGCVQRPQSGMLIGLEGSVFSTDPVEIRYPGYSSSSSPTEESKIHKGLSQGAVIGIAVGLGSLLLVVIAMLFICWRKGSKRRRMTRLRSPLDSRFGAKNITSPSNGAYGNPYESPPITVNESFDTSAFATKRLAILGHQHPVVSKQRKDLKGADGKEIWIETQSQLVTPSAYPGASMPIHQAYIPNSQPVSPATSIGTNSSYQEPFYPSTKPSPKNIAAPQQVHVTEIRPSQEDSARIYAPGLHSQQRPHHQLYYQQQEESSRIYAPSSHSQKSHQQQPGSRPPSRAHSIAESFKRGTALIGVGNANANTEKPMRISGPIIQHGARFDFELAERERLERERNDDPIVLVKKNPENTSSVETEEQWPGTY